MHFDCMSLHHGDMESLLYEAPCAISINRLALGDRLD
jgi:hypothetical protein